MQNCGVKQVSALEDVTKLASSTQLIDMSILTSTTTKAWKLASKDFLLPILDPIFALDVVSIVIANSEANIIEGVDGNVNVGEEVVLANTNANVSLDKDEDENQAVDEVTSNETKGKRRMEGVYALVGTNGPVQVTEANGVPPTTQKP